MTSPINTQIALTPAFVGQFRFLPERCQIDVRPSASTTIAVLLAGASVGVFIGLSVSPVVGGVIPVMLGLVISGIALLAGIKHSKLCDSISINMWPVAALFVALMFGALAGVRLRTAEWLRADPEEAMKRWTQPPFGLSKDVVAKRLFDLAYPLDSIADSGSEGKDDQKHQAAARTNPFGDVGLYDATTNLSVCTKVQMAGPQQKRDVIAAENSRYWKRINALTTSLSDSDLVAALSDLCFQGK